MPSRHSFAGALAVLALSASAGGAQQVVQLPNQGPHYPQSVIENTSNGAGTGLFAVTLTNGNGTQTYLGTASSVTFSTANGVSSAPLVGSGGTVVVYFAPNNSLFTTVALQPCFLPQHAGCSQLATLTIQQFAGTLLTTTVMYVVEPAYAYGVGVFTYQAVQSTTVSNVTVR